MYFEENAQKLREIGLSEDEIKAFKTSRWLLEHCIPGEVFLLKLAYFSKYRRSPGYRIMKGDQETVKHFEKNARHMLEVFVLQCSEAAAEYMRDHFERFLYIPKERLDHHHFRVFTDFLFSTRYGFSVVYSLVDFEVYLFEEEPVFFCCLYLRNQGVMWIERKEGEGRTKRIWILSGRLTSKNLEDIMEGSVKFAEKFFSSELWHKLELISSLLSSLENLEELSGSRRRYEEKMEKMREIKDWFDTLRVIKPAVLRTGRVPEDFMSQITVMYSRLLEEYMEM